MYVDKKNKKNIEYYIRKKWMRVCYISNNVLKK